MVNNFTIRVYGICINNGNVLLSNEFFSNTQMLKFPGGGLEFGEGTLDCLRREMLEEFGLTVEVLQHFYTTDFFVSSAFHPHTQVMSIYYLMDTGSQQVPVGKLFAEPKGHQTLMWYVLKDLNPESLTFPIDQHVARLLVEKF